MKKRIFSLVLALVMVLGLLPATTRAAELDNGLVYEVVGDHVKITGYTGGAAEVVVPAEIGGLPVTVIGEDAFYNCESLTSVDLPEGLASIDRWAFTRCESLTSIDIPDSVTSIGDHAFYSCESLSSIYLPEYVTTIGEYAFTGCASLEGIYVSEENPAYSCDSRGVLFNKDKTRLIQAPGTLSEHYAIPYTVNYLGGFAFAWCSELTSVTIPGSVQMVGPCPFSQSKAMQSVEFLGSAPVCDFVDEYGEMSVLYSLTAFVYYPSWDLSWTDEVKHSYGGRNITWVAVDSEPVDPGLVYAFCEDHVEIIDYIGDTAAVVIPSEIGGLPVTVIVDWAFVNCDTLTSISIPDSVTYIGEGVFFGHSNLTGIYVDAANPNYSSDSRGVLFDKEKTTLIAAPGAISGFYAIPEGVKQIGIHAFAHCNALTDISIPNTVTTIEQQAFVWNLGLTSVTIPESVSWIGDHAFSRCESLTGIHVDGNNSNYSSDSSGVLFNKEQTHLIQAPGGLAGFYEIPGSVAHIGSSAFVSCYELTGVSIPDGTVSIGDDAFSSCVNLYAVFIPDTVAQIGNFAFAFCYNLSEIAFEGDAPVFGEDVFLEVPAIVYYPVYDTSWTEDVMHSHGGSLTWVPYPENPFADVPSGSFYETPVLWALAEGITTGATATTFNPNGQCLRAHVVTFLHRAAGNPAPSASRNPFTDVKSSDFFYQPVLWAVEEGITNGVSTTKFGSFDVCNRAAVVTFLWRAAGSPEPRSTRHPFVDVKATDFFYKPVLWAVENGITNGVDATHFGPTTPCNRAQVVTFLYRAYH